MSQEECLHIVPVPSLVATLLRRETDKGTPLTEAEVLAIRDNCPSIAITDEMLEQLVEGRGYEDIDPENAWDEWQAIRPSLMRGEEPDIL
jgi:hypothetical protein